MKAPSQTEVAKAAGVSQRTVAAVVGRVAKNDSTRVSEKTRQRVLAVAQRMNYRPNRAAQMMRGRRSNLIMHLDSGGYSELASLRSYHLGRFTHEAGFDYQALNSFWWPKEDERILNSILAARPEGLVVSGSLHVKTEFSPILTAGIPVVGLGEKIPDSLLWIRHDARKAVAEITRRCLEQDRMPALLMSETPHYSTNARRLGFLDALTEAGLTHVPEVTLRALPAGQARHPAIWMHNHGRELFEPYEAGKDAVRLLIEKDCLPEALVCSNDHYAIGAMTALLQADIRIPGDIMVSGYDNLIYSQQGPVPLTTVEQPIEAMCGKAIDFLVKQIRHPTLPKNPNAKSVHACRIHWRQSLPKEPLRSPLALSH